jgi:hypothetical protein
MPFAGLPTILIRSVDRIVVGSGTELPVTGDLALVVRSAMISAFAAAIWWRWRTGRPQPARTT